MTTPNYSYDFYDWDPTLYDYGYDYKTTQTKPDTDIMKEIESQLWWSPWVDADVIHRVYVEKRHGRCMSICRVTSPFYNL